MTLLRGIGVPVLCSAEMTGEWEFKLAEMEKGKFSREKFMEEICDLTETIVQKAKTFDSTTVEGDYTTLTVACPKCGKGPVKEYYRTFKCSACDFELKKVLASRQYEIPEVEELLSKRKVGPLQGFRNKMGRPFNALVRLNAELKPEFFWDEAVGANGEVAVVDFSGQEPLGKCLICGSNVYENPMSYVCEKSVGTTRSCTFRSGKIILKREIPREQMVKLLQTGKTDLIDKFISKKGRPFSAYLKFENGKVSFEFEPRKAKVPKAGARKKEETPEPAAAEAVAMVSAETPVPKKTRAPRKKKPEATEEKE